MDEVMVWSRALSDQEIQEVWAPNAKLRYQVIALEPEQGTAQESPSGQLDTQAVTGSSDGATPGRRTSSRWATLIARIYDVLPLACPSCGASMSIIAFITDPVPLHAILSYLDLASPIVERWRETSS